MIKYVNYGHPSYGIHMYVITMYRTEHGSYKVEVLPCDTQGTPVSDAVAQDMFPCWGTQESMCGSNKKNFISMLMDDVEKRRSF